MFVTIVIVFILLLISVSGLLYFVNQKSPDHRLDLWVSDSVRAWREDELGTDDFTVKMKDTKLDDVFTVFEAKDNEPAYLSPDEIFKVA